MVWFEWVDWCVCGQRECEAAGVVGGRRLGRSCDWDISPELSALCLCSRSSEQHWGGSSGPNPNSSSNKQSAILECGHPYVPIVWWCLLIKHTVAMKAACVTMTKLVLMSVKFRFGVIITNLGIVYPVNKMYHVVPNLHNFSFTKEDS